LSQRAVGCCCSLTKCARGGGCAGSNCPFLNQKERDNETGLDYFGARYYASTLGRFTSADPLLASGRTSMPQSWNRYSYVLNNPLKLIDPTGLADDDPNEQEPEKIPDKGYYMKIDVGANKTVDRKEVVNGSEQTVIGAERQLQVTVYNDGQEVRSDSVTVSETVQPGEPTVSDGKGGRSPAPESITSRINQGSRDATGQEFSTNAPPGKVIGDVQSLSVAAPNSQSARQSADTFKRADVRVTDRVIFSVKVDGVVVGARDIRSTKTITNITVTVGEYRKFPQ
jgi:RHS repeat-associated protein